MIYMTFERGGPKFLNITARALTYLTAVQERQLRLSNEITNAKNLVLHSSHFAFN